MVSFLFVFFILTSSFPSIVTDGNTTDSGVFKINYISGTRANDTVNYTQLCLDYIRTEYDNNNISLLNTDERITEETGVNYTVVTVSWLLEDGGLEYEIVSINHLTLNIEIGTDQIDEDYDMYVSMLSPPYNKMNWYSRGIFIDHFGSFPSLSVTQDSDYYCSGYLSVYDENVTLFTQELNASFEHVEWNITDHFELAGVTQIHIKDACLYDFLVVLNISYARSGFLSEGLYTMDSNSFLVQVIYLSIIIFGCLLTAIYITRRKRRKIEKMKPKGD